MSSVKYQKSPHDVIDGFGAAQSSMTVQRYP